jgi:hypothetical protein
MEQIFEAVMKKLEDDLDANERESNPLIRLSKNIELVKLAICVLFGEPAFVLDYLFEEDGQIPGNKCLLPRLYSRLILFRKKDQLECCKLYSSAEALGSFCIKELDAIHHFFTVRRTFCQYYQSGNTEDDWQLFTYRNRAAAHEEPCLKEDLPYRNNACMLVSCILAYEEFGAILKQELATPAEPGPHRRKRKASWNLSDTDLVEKIIGEYELGTTSFDGKPATLDALVEEEQEYYGISLKNYKGALQNIQGRKSGPAVYHDKAKAALLRRNDELLEGKRRKRRLKTR